MSNLIGIIKECMGTCPESTSKEKKDVLLIHDQPKKVGWWIGNHKVN